MELDKAVELLREVESNLNSFDNHFGLPDDLKARIKLARKDLQERKIFILEVLMQYCAGECIFVKIGENRTDALVDISPDGYHLSVRPWEELFKPDAIVYEACRHYRANEIKFQPLVISLFGKALQKTSQMTDDSVFLRKQLIKLQELLTKKK
jgi:hypothetical protein